MKEWRLSLGYDTRIGALMLGVTAPGAAAEAAHFRVPFSAILRDLKVPPGALRQMALDARKPDEDAPDMETLLRAGVPADCAGLTVLDVGGYDGRMAALALERGAARAVCLDSGQWGHYGWTKPDPLPGVEYRCGDFRSWLEPADVVLFYNVLYHVEDPWRALEHLRAITRREMVLCSLVVWNDAPVWEIYEPREVNPADDTVYWGPSEAGLRRLLKLTGWTEVTEVGKAFERLVLRCK